MKKKEVLIEIKGVYRQDDEAEELNFFTTGFYYKEKGLYCISYDESEMTGMEGCHTTLKVDSDRCVTLIRTGSWKSQLIIERGVRHQCHYNTGEGAMMIGVSGDRVVSELDENGGSLIFSYSLDINTSLASENDLYVNVRKAIQ